MKPDAASMPSYLLGKQTEKNPVRGRLYKGGGKKSVLNGLQEVEQRPNTPPC